MFTECPTAVVRELNCFHIQVYTVSLSRAWCRRVFCMKEYQSGAETKDCGLYFISCSATLEVNQPWQLLQW